MQMWLIVTGSVSISCMSSDMTCVRAVVYRKQRHGVLLHSFILLMLLCSLISLCV